MTLLKNSDKINTNLIDNSANRNAALDFLRGVAILMVMLTHVATLDKVLAIHFPAKQFRLFLTFFYIGGWSGVDMFFVLSGFLVSGLLFNEFKKTGNIQPGRFLIRRGLKIYPSFAFFIIVTFIIEVGFNYTSTTEPHLPIDYIKDLLFLHNYLGGRWGTTWSLDVEEVFYFSLICFFLVCIAKKKLTLKVISLTYLLLMVFGITMRLIVNIQHPAYNFDEHYTYSHFRLDGLFFGVLLSFIYNFHKVQFSVLIKKYKVIIMAVALTLVLPNFLFWREHNNWISVVMLAINPVCFGAIIMVAIESKSLFLKNKLITLIGKNSYAIYLWHAFVNDVLLVKVNPAGSLTHYLTYFACFMVISVVVGIIVTKLIEDPFLALRDKVFPSKSKSPIVPVTIVPAHGSSVRGVIVDGYDTAALK